MNSKPRGIGADYLVHDIVEPDAAAEDARVGSK